MGQRRAGGGGRDGSAPAVHGSCCHSPVASQDPASVQSPLSVESLCPSRCGSLPAVGPGTVAQAQAAQGAAVLEIQRARGSEGPTPRGHPLPARSSVSLPSPNGDHPPTSAVETGPGASIGLPGFCHSLWSSPTYATPTHTQNRVTGRFRVSCLRRVSEVSEAPAHRSLEVSVGARACFCPPPLCF